MTLKILALAIATFLLQASAWAQGKPVIAIVGATIIDGTDGDPIQNGVLLIENGRIARVGNKRDVAVPKNARQIDARGKYVIPGLIDTNVHITGYFQKELFALYAYGEQEPYEKYGYSLEGAQMALKYGVTTIMDTYGPLMPLLKLRDRINKGEAVGPRLMVGGNIIGWGGPLSASEQPGKVPTPIETAQNKWFIQGTGVDLTAMYPEDAVKAVQKYLDLGPDFIKIGTTTHGMSPPITLSFSAQVHKMIVDAAHARGVAVEVHSGSVEGHRMAVTTGVDIITHADLVALEFRPELIEQMCKSSTYFAPFANFTGTEEHRHLLETATGTDREGLQAKKAVKEAYEKVRNADRIQVSRLPHVLENPPDAARSALNASAAINQKRMIEGGCKIVIGTDSTPGDPPDLRGAATPIHSDMGTGTLLAMEGLVVAGMSPKEVLISATRRGAEAAMIGDKVGTLQPGKAADLLILNDDPLKNISNVRDISEVIRDGVIIDRAALPTKPFIYKR